jgi:hypothetical protein
MVTLALPSLAFAQGRSFIYRELSLALQYSAEQAQVTSSSRPPGTAIGLEFMHTRKMPDRGKIGLLGIDIHARLTDPPGETNPDVYFADAWALFGVGGKRSQLRVGHFNIPFGMNPVMEPRGIFLMPLEALDLGFKKDWGIAWQREAGEFDVEFGGFLGNGGDLHWRQGSFLLCTRAGTPTFRDLEYGVSMLVGDIPPTMGNVRLSDELIRRVRMGFDAMYMYGNYTVFKGEFAAGTDDGRTMVGALFGIDWVPPRFTRWAFSFQAEGIRRNQLSDFSDIARVTFETSMALGRVTMLRIDIVRTLEGSVGTDVFFMIHHYGR